MRENHRFGKNSLIQHFLTFTSLRPNGGIKYGGRTLTADEIRTVVEHVWKYLTAADKYIGITVTEFGEYLKKFPCVRVRDG